MVQLTDDCFAVDGPLMTVEDALDRVRARLRPVTAIETVGLDAALGRVLAETVVSAMNDPPAEAR